MKYTADDIYPNIAISFNISVAKDERTSKWHWNAKLHLVGPDDVFDRQSPPFDSKEQATINMLARINDLFKELMAEANS